MRFPGLCLATALALGGVAPVEAAEAEATEANHPEARPFDENANASVDIAMAFARALMARKRVLLILGANWCHDSRGLAGWFETPRFADMIAAHYELVYVDVGSPQTGDGRNLEIARRFGIEEMTGTPNVLILSPFGDVLNADTARTWNDAASRSEDDIYAYFAELK